MQTLNYQINDSFVSYEYDNNQEYKIGEDLVLSNKQTDITFDQDWYNIGYKSIPTFSEEEFSTLYNGLNSSIRKIIEEVLRLDIPEFKLENYHHWVKSNEDHFKVVTKTSDLFAEDFNFNILDLIPKFESILNINLSDIDTITKQKIHIIVRINRPGSQDFNPPHKDIYEGVDNISTIPQFINLWVPIAGVTEKTSLPMVPHSHLIPESKIIRTVTGANISNKKYRVRSIKEWDGNNKLIRAEVKYGEVLYFSSHLIHGLATNEESDTTRVALEFRLSKKE